MVKGEDRKLYESFILDRLKDNRKEEYEKGIDQRVLGDEEFIEEINKKTNQELLKKEKTLQEVADRVINMSRLDKDLLQGRKRSEELKRARSLFVHLSLQYTRA